MIIGENGILTQTEKAKELTEQAEKDVQQEMSSLADEIKTLTGDTSMKVLMNSGNKGIIIAPVRQFQGTIDWGDGTLETIENVSSDITHTYSKNNEEYTIKITGTAYSIDSYDTWMTTSSTIVNCDKILKILDWGELGVNTVYLGYCTNLTEIASPREKSFENVVSFSFERCTSLTNIPLDLFDNCSSVTSFNKIFMSCTSLTSIPSNLFANCTKVTDFANAFAYCENITNIPSNLFVNSPNVTDFSGTFNCTSLTSIPQDLFANCPNVTNFSRAFEECTSLTSIPSNLFANCSNVTDFSRAFEGCTNLTSVPSDLFANCSKATSFYRTFMECTSLTGSSIRLWEDTNRATYGITENSGGEGCYYGCINLNDYSTIPEYWKKETTLPK